MPHLTFSICITTLTILSFGLATVLQPHKSNCMQSWENKLENEELVAVCLFHEVRNRNTTTSFSDFKAPTSKLIDLIESDKFTASNTTMYGIEIRVARNCSVGSNIKFTQDKEVEDIVRLHLGPDEFIVRIEGMILWAVIPTYIGCHTYVMHFHILESTEYNIKVVHLRDNFEAINELTHDWAMINYQTIVDAILFLNTTSAYSDSVVTNANMKILNSEQANDTTTQKKMHARCSTLWHVIPFSAMSATAKVKFRSPILKEPQPVCTLKDVQGGTWYRNISRLNTRVTVSKFSGQFLGPLGKRRNNSHGSSHIYYDYPLPLYCITASG